MCWVCCTPPCSLSSATSCKRESLSSSFAQDTLHPNDREDILSMQATQRPNVAEIEVSGHAQQNS